MAQRIILDCDPGIDDALAIAFAHGHPGIELVGITTVAGNVGLAKTTANALAVSEFVGAAGTPVTAGCAGPLLRPALDARQVHGDSGLGGAVSLNRLRWQRWLTRVGGTAWAAALSLDETRSSQAARSAKSLLLCLQHSNTR